MAAEAVHHRPVGLPLDKEPQLVPKGLSQEAVDDGVEAAVGERRQVHDVACERVVVPKGGRRPLRGVGCDLQQLDADEDVLRQPADEEHQHHHHDHTKGLLPPRPQPTVLPRPHEDAPDEGVAQADDGEGHQEADGHLQPLDLEDVGEAEVQLAPVLRLHDGEGEERGQDGGHPDEAAAELGVLHSPQRAAAHRAGQGHVAVEAHPGEEEDAAVHVDLQKEGHEGAEDGVVVVLLVEVEDLDERVGHQDEVGYGQVDKVEVRDGHLLSVVQVDHQDQDVADKSDGEEEDGVEAGQEEANDVGVVLFQLFHQTRGVVLHGSVESISAVCVHPHQRRLHLHTARGRGVSAEATCNPTAASTSSDPGTSRWRVPEG